jgi:hypothetical protein
MPARKRQQSSAMLYILTASVILFIIATICAVVFYVKAEDYKTTNATLQKERDDLANGTERQALGKTVGAKQPRTSWLATLAGHLDTAVVIIGGGVAPDTSAEVKLKNADTEYRDALSTAGQYVDFSGLDPNKIGLVRVVKGLKEKLDQMAQQQMALKGQLKQLQDKFDDALAVSAAREKVIEQEKQKLLQRVTEITEDHDRLKALLEQTSDERAQVLMTQLEDERAMLNAANQELLKTQAELDMTRDMLQRAQTEVAAIKPPPDSNVAAYQADGRIILVEDPTQVVHISLGSDDHVYRGLTFTVYDRGPSIPKDGKGKAEVEVFDVAKNYSAARIVSFDKKRPILRGDLVANLIWDSSKTNVFVVAGEFDLDNNGTVDRGAREKIGALIEKWGGKVADAISVETDFLVLGQRPFVLKKPTLEELEVDPFAMDKYDASQQNLDRYKEVQNQAQSLWIPILKYDRFLYFIGYKGQVGKAGAF